MWMTDETDAQLVAALRRGDRDAAGRLVGRYLRACRAVALSIVGDVAGSEDMAQDAVVYAVQHIDECRRPERFAGWLMQIVRSLSRNHVRDRRADRHIDVDTVPLHSLRPSPHVEAERSELRRQLVAALAELPEERRQVVLLHDLEGWTHREIAERLELPAGTVRSHLHHARRQLRGILGGLNEGSE